MNLRTYLHGTTQAALAAELDVSQGTIAHWIAGRVRVPAERCRAIEAATDGAVTIHDLRPDIFGPAPGVPPVLPPPPQAEDRAA
jgi:DNA-binding transcriptional regulator YdaS (Cro superfamily)